MQMVVNVITFEHAALLPLQVYVNGCKSHHITVYVIGV